MPETNHQILLVSRPKGAATAANFRMVAVPLAPLAEGEVRVRNHFLSLDPYMRGRMNDRKSYAPPQALGEVMQGGTVGEVVESRNPAWRPGDTVVAMFGWQEYGVSDGSGMRKVDATKVPLSAYLGAVGMPGVTAWYGLHRICGPRAGETVAVSAASGAVGSVVGQLAKRLGCRAVGIAGGPEKCRYVVEKLGLDACVDHKAGRLEADLGAAAPDGIDAYFDNVGGTVLDAAMLSMNAHGRIAICGAIAGYDGQPLRMANPTLILTSRLRIEGFIVSEHMEDWSAALEELGGLVAAGDLKFRESVALGLMSAPEAFLGMLKGRNFGKQLVTLI
ncbi:MAG: NADP-dependent oxidoreductase [Rhodospirillales bacterium]|nr:NADP-dependent oxidoreductase [Rhodospirillales bacterium]